MGDIHKKHKDKEIYWQLTKEDNEENFFACRKETLLKMHNAEA